MFWLHRDDGAHSVGATQRTRRAEQLVPTSTHRREVLVRNAKDGATAQPTWQ